MEAMVERENMWSALRRVERNKGAAGVDNMPVEDLRPHLKEYWPRIKERNTLMNLGSCHCIINSKDFNLHHEPPWYGTVCPRGVRGRRGRPRLLLDTPKVKKVQLKPQGDSL